MTKNLNATFFYIKCTYMLQFRVYCNSWMFKRIQTHLHHADLGSFVKV